MINVSDAFKTAIKAQSREIKGLIEFEILDIDANTDATASATSENEFSKKDQLFNQNRLLSGKYATFETDYWKLDGSFVLPPKPTESGYEVGWWSDTLSNSVGSLEGTTNVVTSTAYAGDGGGLSYSEPNVTFRGRVVKRFVTGASGNFYLNAGGAFGYSYSTNWTSVVYIKRKDGTPLTAVGTYMYVTSNANNNISVIAELVEDGWYRIERRRTGLVSGQVGLVGCYGFPAGAELYISEMQVEAKPYSTEFVWGTRLDQVVTCDFTIDHSSIGITITFDTQTNEYAKDFTINAYDSSAVLIDSVTVADNTLTTYIWENNLSNFRQIEITIAKWCTPGRRARITEIDFGIIKQCSDNELINMNILEELDTTSNTTTANEIKFTLDNQSKDFNILNPAGVYPYLQRKQKIKPYLGVVVTDSLTEYLKMGVFYLNEWKSDEGTLTATFTARDLIDVVSDDDFAETSYISKSLKYILEDILADAGITEYNIDTALDAIIVTGTVAKSKHREAIQVVALAGMAVAYCDRDGILQVKQLTTPAPVDTIDYGNVYSPPQIVLDKLINTVNVKYGASTYTLVDPSKPTNEQTLAVTVDNPLIGTLAHAQDVANWLLAEYKKRFLYEVNWRMDQSLEPGDIVTVEDDFSEDKTARITRNEFQYSGYLSGKTNGRGGA